MDKASSNPNASCSEDRASAAKLSRSLRAGPAAGPAPAEPYTRLAAPSLAPPSAFRPSTRPEDLPTHVGAEGWNRLLASYAGYTGAKEIFIVDASGLAVASLGIPSGWDLERVGSRLALAFDQADRMGEQPCRHLTVDLGGRHLTGIRLRDPEEGTLTLGVLGDRPLDPVLVDGLTKR